MTAAASANGNSIVFNSVDWGGTSYNLFVVGVPSGIPPAPEMEVHVEKLAQADGCVTQGSSWKPLVIELRCIVLSDTAANRATQVANIITALKTCEGGEKTLVLDAYSSKSYNVRLMNSVNASIAAQGAEFTLIFLASNPWGTAT